MNPKHLVCRSLLALSLFVGVSCVDKSFDISEVSPEVTVGQGTTTVPIGYLNPKTLKDLIGENNLEGLNVDPKTGDYSLSFESDPEKIHFSGVDNTIYIPRTSGSVEIDYPDFTLNGDTYHIDEGMELNSLIAGKPLPEIEFFVPAGHTISVDESDKVQYELNYRIPNEVKSIKRVYLKHDADEPGARIDATVKFNDVNAINGGGHVNIRLAASDGYEMYDENYQLLEDNVFEVNNYTFKAGQAEVGFTIYIASLRNDSNIVDGNLTIPVEMEYELSYDMTTREGLVHIEKFPELHLEGYLTFDDAEVVLSGASFIDERETLHETIRIENLPKEVKSLQEIVFDDKSAIRIFADGLDWIGDGVAESLVLKTKLPEYIILEDNPAIGYDAATHTIETTLKNMRMGIDAHIESITFSEGGIEPVDGDLVIDFDAIVEAHIEDDLTIRLSEVCHDGDVTIEAGFDEANLNISAVTGRVDYYFERIEEIEVGNIGEDIDIQVNNIGLSPVIFIKVDSPLSMSSYLTLTFVPTFDGVPDNERSRKVREIPINPATYENGVLKNGSTHIIIADEQRREEYSDAVYTFVPCDIASIFTGNRLPDKVTLDIELETDARSNSTLYATDDYTVTFIYGADMPIAFDDCLDVVYKGSFSGLNSMFADFAMQDIKVGDVALIAEVANTTPMSLDLSAQLFDLDGTPSDVKLMIPADNSNISGSADGKTESVSTVRMELNFGADGALTCLKNVDALKLTLSATSAGDGTVALNENQYLALKLKAEVKGGVTVNLESLLSGDEE